MSYPHLHLDEQLQRADDLTPDEILSICADIRRQRQEAADKRIAGGSFDRAIDEMERREREIEQMARAAIAKATGDSSPSAKE